MTTAGNSPRPLDPALLATVRGLELQARLLVEGFLSGMHPSPYHGFSVEFAQHREYVPGDDVKHVDWKVYGRTGRFYLKQYEAETNLACWLAVDVSESMRYRSADLAKSDVAALAAAALAHLVLHQQDSVGLVTFDDQVRQFLRPSSQPGHLREIVRILTQGPGQEKTQLGPLLHGLAERIRRRGLVLIFSDLFDEPAALLDGLRHLRWQGHEVVVFHVLDGAEVDFPFQEATLFRGLEGPAEVLTDPRSLRRGYLERFRAFVDGLERGCRNQDIELVTLRTDRALGISLASWLARRAIRR